VTGLLAAALLRLALAGPAGDCGATPYDCALFHVGRHEFAEAIRYLHQRLAAAPRDLKALNLLGIALTGAGRRDEADRRFRAALAVDPTFTPALKNLAVNEYDAGRTVAARSHFEKALALAPTDEIAHVYLAEIDYAAKRLRSALQHYEKAGERIGQSPVWTLHYGRSLLEARHVAEAIPVLDRIPPQEFAALFEAGVALGQAGAHADAARYFAAARKGYSDRYAAGYNQALMLIEASDDEGAIRAGRELIAEGRAPGELYNLLARAYVRSGRVQEAYDALRQATRLEPDAPDNYVDLVMICVEHDNFDLGLEIVGIGLGRLPGSWVLHVQRGVLLAMKADPAEAEREFETARRLAPGQTVPWAALGMVWMEGGQADKAVEVLRGEMKRGKDHVLPYIFAMALLRSGVDPAAPAAAEAVEALRASIRANPEFAPARAELGRLLFKRDELDLALRELEKAAALDPANTQALYFLAQAYRKKGDRARAQELLARVSRVNAEERGDDPSSALRRAVVRIVREGTAPTPRPR
jgi:predicted Zn-dependent protease